MLKNDLKKIRMKEYLMNIKEFSNFLEIDEKQYGRYERSLSSPSLEVAIKISQKLKKTVNEIWY